MAMPGTRPIRQPDLTFSVSRTLELQWKNWKVPFPERSGHVCCHGRIDVEQGGYDLDEDLHFLCSSLGNGGQVDQHVDLQHAKCQVNFTSLESAVHVAPQWRHTVRKHRNSL